MIAGGDGDVGLRPLGRGDLPRLGDWLRQPHVARWWRDPSDLRSLEEKYGPCIAGEDPTEVFVAEVAGRPIGLIQRYLLDDYPEWGKALRLGDVPAAGIDYLIGEPQFTGRGVGATMIDRFTDLTFARYPQIRLVTADPQQDNVASCRALERAGFRIAWSGRIHSDDPSDAGPSHVYVRWRAGATPSNTTRTA